MHLSHSLKPEPKIIALPHYEVIKAQSLLVRKPKPIWRKLRTVKNDITLLKFYLHQTNKEH